MRKDLAAVGCYAAAAGYVTNGLWRDPDATMLAHNEQDHIQAQWFLLHGARTVLDLRDPFFTDWLNAPYGVNLMANTSVWTAALPLTPVTLLLGPAVAVALFTTLALAATATAWYAVLSRHLVRSRLAAFVGGAFCGFAPAMIAQATGHPNVASQFLVPFMVLTVLRLRTAAGPLRPGLTLAALVVAQFFLNEEILLITALALGLLVLAYWGLRPAQVRPVLGRAAAALGVTALAAGAVLAYPMWVQFAGPQSYHGLRPEHVNAFGTDLASYPAYARESLAGHAAVAARLANGVPEQNTFFGWSLLVVLIGVAVWLRREPLVRALATVALVFAVFSLGTYVRVGGHDTAIRAPWLLFSKAPVLDSVVPTRFALVVTAVAGVLLAVFLDRISPTDRTWPALRVVGTLAVAAALLPTAPTPLTTVAAPRSPRFFADARAVPDGGTVLFLPFGWHSTLRAMHWQTRAGMRFRIVSGYFLGPADGVRGRPAQLGPPVSRTWTVFAEDADWTRPRPVSDADRAAVRDELRRWRVSTVVLPADHPHAAAVRATAQDVYGPAEQSGGVWVWRVSGAP